MSRAGGAARTAPRSPPHPGPEDRRDGGRGAAVRGAGETPAAPQIAGFPVCAPPLPPPRPVWLLRGDCLRCHPPPKNTTPQNRSKYSGLVFFLGGAQIRGVGVLMLLGVPAPGNRLHTHTHTHTGGIIAQRPLCPAPLPCTPAPLLACVFSAISPAGQPRGVSDSTVCPSSLPPVRWKLSAAGRFQGLSPPQPKAPPDNPAWSFM